MSKSKYKNKSWRRNRRIDKKCGEFIKMRMMIKLNNIVIKDTVLYGEWFARAEYENIFSTLARFNIKSKSFDKTHTLDIPHLKSMINEKIIEREKFYRELKSGYTV